MQERICNKLCARIDARNFRASMWFVKLIAKLASCVVPGKARRNQTRAKIAIYLINKFFSMLGCLLACKNQNQSGNYPLLEKLCKGKRCIVVGSAPSANLSTIGFGDVVIGANGGAAIAQQHGHTVSIFCTTRWLLQKENLTPQEMTARTRQEMATRKILSGLSVSATYVTNGDGADVNADADIDFDDCNIDAGVVHSISYSAKERMVKCVCGFPLCISTGLFGVCLAILGGASSVEMVGFSLGRGHFNMPWDTASRSHVLEDAAFLSALRHTPHTLTIVGK